MNAILMLDFMLFIEQCAINYITWQINDEMTISFSFDKMRFGGTTFFYMCRIQEVSNVSERSPEIHGFLR